MSTDIEVDAPMPLTAVNELVQTIRDMDRSLRRSIDELRWEQKHVRENVHALSARVATVEGSATAAITSGTAGVQSTSAADVSDPAGNIGAANPVAANAGAASAGANGAGGVNGAVGPGGGANAGASGGGGNGVATDPQIANIVAAVVRTLKNPPSNTTTTAKTAPRAYSHPILDYAAASVLFATSYLSLDRRRRRGAAYAIPLIPVAVGALEAYTQAQRLENNHDAKLGLAAAGAGSLGALLIGAR